MDENGDRQIDFDVLDLDPEKGKSRILLWNNKRENSF